jgi:hypothetical protein
MDEEKRIEGGETSEPEAASSGVGGFIRHHPIASLAVAATVGSFFSLEVGVGALVGGAVTLYATRGTPRIPFWQRGRDYLSRFMGPTVPNGPPEPGAKTEQPDRPPGERPTTH